MAAHAGLRIDAARHRCPDHPSIDQYSDARFAGPGVGLDMRPDGPVPISAHKVGDATPEIR